MLTLATSIHLRPYPRRRHLIFLSYFASLEPKGYVIIVSVLQFSSKVVALDPFFPRRPIDIFTLREKEIFFGSGDCNDLCSFFHRYILLKGINTFFGGHCQLTDQKELFFPSHEALHLSLGCSCERFLSGSMW